MHDRQERWAFGIDLGVVAIASDTFTSTTSAGFLRPGTLLAQAFSALDDIAHAGDRPMQLETQTIRATVAGGTIGSEIAGMLISPEENNFNSALATILMAGSVLTKENPISRTDQIKAAAIGVAYGLIGAACTSREEPLGGVLATVLIRTLIEPGIEKFTQFVRLRREQQQAAAPVQR